VTTATETDVKLRCAVGVCSREQIYSAFVQITLYEFQRVSSLVVSLFNSATGAAASCSYVSEIRLPLVTARIATAVQTGVISLAQDGKQRDASLLQELDNVIARQTLLFRNRLLSALRTSMPTFQMTILSRPNITTLNAFALDWSFNSIEFRRQQFDLMACERFPDVPDRESIPLPAAHWTPCSRATRKPANQLKLSRPNRMVFHVTLPKHFTFHGSNFYAEATPAARLGNSVSLSYKVSRMSVLRHVQCSIYWIRAILQSCVSAG
jgi:hypothetical protein